MVGGSGTGGKAEVAPQKGRGVGTGFRPQGRTLEVEKLQGRRVQIVGVPIGRGLAPLLAVPPALPSIPERDSLLRPRLRDPTVLGVGVGCTETVGFYKTGVGRRRNLEKEGVGVGASINRLMRNFVYRRPKGLIRAKGHRNRKFNG